MQASLVDPTAESTFRQSKIDLNELKQSYHAHIYQLHKDVLRLRREEPAFRRVQKRGDVDGAVLSCDAFVLRFFGRGNVGGASGGADADRLLVVNLGRDLDLDLAPEPLLAAPPGYRWGMIFSSEDPRYGGTGTAPPETELEGWFLQGRCAMVLKPMPTEQAQVHTRVRGEGSAQEARRLERQQHEEPGK
jgi:maltooligosyltrehalose trehalohydrolase